nr:hypothetical protein [Mammaliicoccus sp. Marseille-Q6498]
MVVDNKKLIKVNRFNEQRSSGISDMIEEGGLGSDRYYQIIKQNDNYTESEENISQFKDEVKEKSNERLLDLLVLNAQERTAENYKEALNVIKAELLKRLGK